MRYNIEQAFTYFLKDRNLIPKASCLYFLIFLIFIPVILLHFNNMAMEVMGILGLLLLCPLFLIFSLFFSGYLAVNTNRRIIKPENNLPELSDWKNFFITGGKFFLGNMAWSFFLTTILFIVILFGSLIFGISSVISPVLGVFSAILMTVVSIGLIIAYFVAMFAILLAFYIDLRIESFFDFNKIKMIITKNFKPLLGLIGWSVVFSFVLGICDMVLTITIIGTIMIPVLYAFYFFALCDLQAQFLRHAFKIEQNEAEVYKS